MAWAVEDAHGIDPQTGEHVDVPPQCLAVLQGLANHAGRDGRNAYPSIDLLAHYSRKGERAVQKDLRTLEDLGVIRRGDQRAAYDIPERYRPAVWDLAMERKRPAYVPARLRVRDAAEGPGDPARGEPEVTPPAPVRGELQDASGVNHSSPEPVTSTTTTQSDLVSHVSRAAPASPALPPAGPPTSPAPAVAAAVRRPPLLGPSSPPLRPARVGAPTGPGRAAFQAALAALPAPPPVPPRRPGAHRAAAPAAAPPASATG